MISRSRYIQKIKRGFENNPIVVLIGARQVGKTSLMQMYSQSHKSFWINGENPETAQLFQRLSDVERYLKINISSTLSGFLIIDEFQYIENVSVILKLLVDKYSDLKILCSGSSSLDILQHVKESLAGRIRVIPVYSLSFEEFVKFNDSSLYEKFKQLDILDNVSLFLPEIELLLKDYLTYGGLPKVALTSDTKEKEELLNDIYQTYLLRDVRQFVRNKDFVGFNKLIKVLSSQNGGLLNINELANTVQLRYRACEEYIQLLEQMYIIQLVPPYTTNKRAEITKMNKIYFSDIGLRNVIYNSFNDIDIRNDNGSLFENFVYLEIVKAMRKDNMFFYRTKDGTEIDFVVVDNRQNIIPVEIKYKRYNKPVKFRGLTEFSNKNSIQNAYVVNLSLNDIKGMPKFIQPYFVSGIICL